MNNKSDSSVHWSFWLISIFFLIWNVMGGVNFIVQMNADMVAKMPETHRAIIDSRPIWATVGFGVGVFAGALGCLLLLLRKSLASPIFVISLLGIIVTMIHTIMVANSVMSFTIIEIIVMILVPILVAVFLIWYTKLIDKKHWIN